MGSALAGITEDPKFTQLLQQELTQPNVQQELHAKIKLIVEQRLNELTPKMVKDIIQNNDPQTLGLASSMGRCFLGGLIGLLAALFNI